MKPNKVVVILLLISVVLALAGCRHDKQHISPTTVSLLEPQGTTVPPETTVPPTTEGPHIELTPDDIVELLYDAGKMYDAGETIILKYDSFTDYYASGSKLAHLGMVDIVKDETITIYCGSDTSKEDGVKERVQYLYTIAKLIELHPDCCYTENNTDRYFFKVFCQYKKVGCDSIEEYTALDYKKIESGNYNYEYDGKMEFTFDIKNGFVCYSIVKIIDTSHIFTDVIDIFEIRDTGSQTTLYEEYINSKSKG